MNRTTDNLDSNNKTVKEVDEKAEIDAPIYK